MKHLFTASPFQSQYMTWLQFIHVRQVPDIQPALAIATPEAARVAAKAAKLPDDFVCSPEFQIILQ